jgi:hypothetical protein
MMELLNSKMHIPSIAQGTYKFHEHEIRIASVYWNLSNSKTSPQDQMRGWWKNHKNFLDKIHLLHGLQLLRNKIDSFLILLLFYSLPCTYYYNMSDFIQDFTDKRLISSKYNDILIIKH